MFLLTDEGESLDKFGMRTRLVKLDSMDTGTFAELSSKSTGNYPFFMAAVNSVESSELKDFSTIRF